MGPKYHHKYPCKKETEGNLKHTQRRRHDVNMEADIGVIQQQTRKCEEPPEAERGCRESVDPANTLILAL